MSLPLHGIRVVDLSRVLAGPLAGMTLGDLGADVIKIERPQLGDDTRGWGPPFDAQGESAYFLATNRNKLSLAADLSDAADQDLVRRLIADSDVVIENYRPGTLERFQLGAQSLLAAHPQLVWCTITGFGADNPRPGYDFVVQAESGWMAITGEPDGAPMKHGVALADVLAGKDAALQILATLAGGRRGNRHLVVSLLHSATAALVNVAQNVLVSGDDARRWGNAHPNLVPYQVFETADQPIVIAVGNDAQWQACARVLGLDVLAQDSSLASNAGRVLARERVVAALATRLRRRPAAESLQLLDRAGVPCGVVKSVREALRGIEASPRTGVAPQGDVAVRFPPPMLDAHGALVRRAGWGAFTEPVS
jgi:crotonobetainyl-CoA:carnitine CoA-transferase CaiB-like acyl-CoA transferase